MRKQTGELIELLHRSIALCHKESDIADIRGSQARRQMAKQLRGVRAIHAKFGKRPLDTMRYVFRFYVDESG